MNTCSHSQTLGAALAARRHQLHLSRTELGRRCDLRPADLRRIEQGRFAPSPSQAYRLAAELQFDAELLCEWTIAQLLIIHPEYLAEHGARAA